MMTAKRKLQIETPEWAIPLLQPSRYKAAYSGRYAGKSHFFCGLLVEDCYRHPFDAVCIREYQSSLKYSSKKLVKEIIEKYGMDKGERRFIIQDNKIITPWGKDIIFVGMQDHNASSIKSLEGFHRFFIEEANDLSQTSLDILRPTVRAKGAEMWFAWNPRDPKEPIDALLRGECPPPDSVVVETNWRQNPWITETMIQEIKDDHKRDPDKAEHIWEGGYEKYSEARVFKNWHVEEFEAPPNAEHRFGSDFGFNSPTTLVRSHILGKRLYIDSEAYRNECELDDIPDLYDEVPESRKWPIIGDSSRPETISHLRKKGFKMFASIKGKGSIKEGIEFLKTYDIIIHPRCIHTIDEMKNFKWKVDPKLVDPETNKPLILPVLVDDHNHIIDPLRYSHEGHRKALKQQQQSINQPPIPVYTPYRKRA